MAPYTIFKSIFWPPFFLGQVLVANQPKLYTHTHRNTYLYTRSHTTIMQKHFLGCGIISPQQLSSHSLYCAKHKSSCNLFLLCLHMISVVQIFLGSCAVRSLNSRMSAISMALYDMGMI